MTFKHTFVNALPPLEAVRTDLGRFYKTPNGKLLPSVTTVLSETKDFKFGKILDALASGQSTKEFSPMQVKIVQGWADKHGGAHAAKHIEGVKITDNGHNLHRCLESLVLNQPVENPHPHFDLFAKVLRENVTEVFGTELGLYSEEIGIAGTTDLAARWRTVPAIIDYKTSVKRKTVSRIKDYFVQTAMYAVLFEAVYGIRIPQLVVLIGDQETNSVKPFEAPTADYIAHAAHRIKQYNQTLANQIDQLPI